jgi:type I restriction enzyme S subunit
MSDDTTEDWTPPTPKVAKHWELVEFELATNNIPISGKKTPQKETLTEGIYPVIDQGQKYIGGYVNDIEKVVELNKPVIVFGDHTRCFKYVDFNFAPGADGTKVLEPTDLYDPKFLYYSLQTLKLPNRGYSRHYSFLKKSTIGLPPLNEQHRIIDKVEQLFAELDKGVESLKTAQEQLKLYRQALLKHAFEGKLTADWREANKGKVERADDLLARIKAEREARYKDQIETWKQAVTEWETKGKEGKKPTKPRALKELEILSNSDLSNAPELPIGWKWGKLGNLLSGLPRSMQSGPFGSNLKHSEFQQSGKLVIGIDNVGNGTFSMGRQNRIPDHKYETLIKYKARAGDLLIVVMASLGRSCIIPNDIEEAIITKHVYRLSFEQQFIHPQFYNLCIQGHTFSRKNMMNNSMGQTRPGLNGGILKEIPVPLCSIKEQKEICLRLDEKLSVLDQMETGISEQLKRSEALRQSILKKAFAGELVAQDPTDEPAAKLLERIKAEKEAQAKTTKPKRRKAS